MAIKFNVDYLGFKSGKTYQAKYAMHPYYGYLAIKVVDEDGDTRYLPFGLLEDGSIVEVDDED